MNIAVKILGMIKNYTYNITANTYIDYGGMISNKSNNLWTKQDILAEGSSNGNIEDNNIKIEAPILVNYEDYRNIVSYFIKNLNISMSAYMDIIFTVTLHVEIQGETYTDVSSSSLRMNLYQPVFDITKTEKGDNEKIISPLVETPNLLIFIVIDTLAILFVVIMLFRKIKKSHTKEYPEYKKIADKIRKKYKNIIVEVVSTSENKETRVIEIKNFEELVNIEEEIRIPILLYENENEINFAILYNHIEYRYILKKSKNSENF